MKPVTQKLLELQLLSTDIIKSMENWGALPKGSSENLGHFFDKPVSTNLYKLMKDLEDLLDQELEVHETNPDLANLKWPIEVTIYSQMPDNLDEVPPHIRKSYFKGRVLAVRDIAGKFYCRIEDVKEDWFVPGYKLTFDYCNPDLGSLILKSWETISERQILYVDDVPVCIKVTTLKEV